MVLFRSPEQTDLHTYLLVSAKFTALRFLYKFYSSVPLAAIFFQCIMMLELNLGREQFCQVILKLVQRFLTKRFLKCFI